MIMPHNLSRSERRMFRLHPEMFEDVQCIGYVGKPGCGYTGGISGDTCPKCGGRMMCVSSRQEAKEMADRAIAAMEKMLEHVCEICGQPISLHKDVEGYWPSRCCAGCSCGHTQPPQEEDV